MQRAVVGERRKMQIRVSAYGEKDGNLREKDEIFRNYGFLCILLISCKE